MDMIHVFLVEATELTKHYHSIAYPDAAYQNTCIWYILEYNMRSKLMNPPDAPPAL